MKVLKLSIMIAFMFDFSNAFSQSDALNFELSPFQFNQVQTNFFPASFNFKQTKASFHPSTLGTSRSIVFKSPVHYEAFFCKMEVKSANKLGIMIKVHAGDYDSYTSGTDQLRP